MSRLATFESLESMEKSPLPSRREERKIRNRHAAVMQWADENLPKLAKQAFFAAVSQQDYQRAFIVLMDEYWANPCVSFWQRTRWDAWLVNREAS